MVIKLSAAIKRCIDIVAIKRYSDIAKPTQDFAIAIVSPGCSSQF
jgi:hypothetical protein